MQVLFWILSFAYAICATLPETPIQTLIEWKYINYAWSSMSQMFEYMSSGKYDYRKIIPIDVDQSQDGRTFITVLMQQGVPASVNTIILNNELTAPVLEPYPNWEAYEHEDPCMTILNVHRIAIDECNRLWILDTGKYGDLPLCPPKLLVYNLYNDSLIFNITIPNKYTKNWRNESLLVTPIVQTAGGECEKTEVFIADSDGCALIVYSAEHESFKRYENSDYMPELENINFSIAGENFILPKGITGMALSPMRYPDGARSVAYMALASRTIYNVDTRLFDSSDNTVNLIYNEAKDALPSQASALAYSSGGTLYYALTRETAIGCANFKYQAFLTLWMDHEKLQFISGMKYIKHWYTPPQHEYLLLLSNRYQKVLRGTMNFDEINFRVLKVSVQALVAGTICDDWHFMF